MNILYGIILFVITILFTIMLSNINIHILVLKSGSRSEVVLNLRFLFNLLKYRVEIPIIDILKGRDIQVSAEVNSDIEIAKKEVVKEGQSRDMDLDELPRIYERLKLIYEKYKMAYRYLSKRTTVKRFVWETEIGMDDAAVTAVITGILWGVKSNISSYLLINKRINNFSLNVVPIFGGEKLSTSLDCIIYIKIGYIIIAALKMLKIKSKE